MPKYDRETNLNSGLPENDGIDEVGRQEILRRLQPRQVNVVGNYADLQRGGAAVLKGEGTVSDGVEPPPGTSVEEIQNQAAVEEKVDAALSKVNDDIVAAATPEKAKAAKKTK
jgi:hypothetical protein